MGYSLISRPVRAICRARSRWRFGYTRSSPVPTTAIVATRRVPLGATSSAPSCAAPSMPIARPDTMVIPACPSARAKRRALAVPCAVGLRLPTIAIRRADAFSPAGSPCRYKTRGGSAISSKALGYKPSPKVTMERCERSLPSAVWSCSQFMVLSTRAGNSGGSLPSAVACTSLTTCASAVNDWQKIPDGNPKAARSFRAVVLPTPVLRVSRNQPASSSRSKGWRSKVWRLSTSGSVVGQARQAAW